jgi:hypothetical protein
LAESNVTNDTASATAVVAAPAEAIFDYIRRPANHSAISGDGTVRGTMAGPEVLGNGDKFGMKMKMGVPYVIRSKVVEFDENRRIAWCHFGGHRWRWELEPLADGNTRVTETFDMTTSKMPPVLRLMGYPKGHRDNVAKSVDHLVAKFGS